MDLNKPFHFDFAEAVVIEELHAIALGNVTTGEPGSDAKITLRREGDTFVFDFVIPQGLPAEEITFDSALNSTSDNAVKNRVIKAYVDEAISQLQDDMDTLAEEVGNLNPDSDQISGKKTGRIEMAASQSSASLLPNVLYVFPEMPALSVTFDGISNPDKVQEYRFRFTSGATPTTLTLPANVLGDITIEANRIYEVSILDGYLVSQSWEVA